VSSYCGEITLNALAGRVMTNRSAGGMRAAVKYFTDKDAPALGSVYANLLMEMTILVAYKPDGSVVRNRAGHALYLPISHWQAEHELSKHIDSFREVLERDATRGELAKCRLKNDPDKGKPEVLAKSVYHIMHPVMPILRFGFRVSLG